MQLQRILTQQNSCFTCLPGQAALGQAVSALALYGKTAVVVLENGKIEGILTRTDVVAHLKKDCHAASQEETISRLMTRNPVMSDPLTTFEQALDRMAQSNIEHLPVVENGRLLSVIHERDLLRNRINTLQTDIDQLRAYIENLHNATQD
jgi:CBS domain-containing protein